jgi:hypothetical protein
MKVTKAVLKNIIKNTTQSEDLKYRKEFEERIGLRKTNIQLRQALKGEIHAFLPYYCTGIIQGSIYKQLFEYFYYCDELDIPLKKKSPSIKDWNDYLSSAELKAQNELMQIAIDCCKNTYMNEDIAVNRFREIGEKARNKFISEIGKCPETIDCEEVSVNSLKVSLEKMNSKVYKVAPKKYDQVQLIKKSKELHNKMDQEKVIYNDDKSLIDNKDGTYSLNFNKNYDKDTGK